LHFLNFRHKSLITVLNIKTLLFVNNFTIFFVKITTLQSVSHTSRFKNVAKILLKNKKMFCFLSLIRRISLLVFDEA